MLHQQKKDKRTHLKLTSTEEPTYIFQSFGEDKVGDEGLVL